MKYNKLERNIGKILDKYPYTRQIAKFLYQRFSYAVYHKKNFTHELHPGISIRSVINNTKLQAFFGYYDKSPWSYDSKYYLLHIFDRNQKNKVKIGVYNCEDDDLNIIDDTSAFNFQQGAMLRWLNQNSYHIIYNAVDDGNLVAKIKDAVSGKTLKTISVPIQTVNLDGTEALTLNYKRLDKIRPEYGYSVDVKNFSHDMPYAEDGIWQIDLNTEQSGLIISLDGLMDLNHDKTMDKSQHKINHIMYSPSGKRFVFMHRWIGPCGKFSRMYTANTDGSDIYCLAHDRMVSHYFWIDDNYIVAFARREPTGDRYFLFKDKTYEYEIIGDGVLDIYGDGHPSVSPDKKWLVTDTYPDKGRVRELILFNLLTKTKIVIGRFFAPWEYDGFYRCDLHPRWSPDGKLVSIDSAHEGTRRSYFIDVSKIVST